MDSGSTDDITIDRRPLWIVMVDRLRRVLFILAIFVVFLVLLKQPVPAGLTEPGYKVLCLFALCVSLWSTNPIPLSITSLIAIAGIPLLGVMDATQAYSFFGNKAVFFILGVFILSAAMIGCGLSARMSVLVFDYWGKSPTQLTLGIYLFGLLGSCFMSEHAVAAMLYPIISELIRALGLNKDSSFAKAMLIAMAWGCIIGGTATVLGGGRVPLAVEILEQTTQGASTIGLKEYTFLTFPLVVLMGFAGWIFLIRMFPPGVSSIVVARVALRKKVFAMGRMSPNEWGIGAVMLMTLFGWFGYGEDLGIANIAILAIVLLFIFNLINWQKVETHVNWAIILMYGGAICLGKAMAETGAALWLAKAVFGGFNSPTGFLILSVSSSVILTTFMSNSAVIAILLPPVLSLSSEFGVGPAVGTMAVVLPSNFAFMLPIATPASALAYSSRHIRLREMILSGAVVVAVGMAGQFFLLWVYWPLVDFL